MNWCTSEWRTLKINRHHVRIIKLQEVRPHSTWLWESHRATSRIWGASRTDLTTSRPGCCSDGGGFTVSWCLGGLCWVPTPHSNTVTQLHIPSTLKKKTTKQQKNNRSSVSLLILVSVSRRSADSYTKPWCPVPLASMHMIDHLVCPCTISSVSSPALGYFKFAPNLSWAVMMMNSAANPILAELSPAKVPLITWDIKKGGRMLD